jgi:ABC-2 type transport system ATP-binding protein
MNDIILNIENFSKAFRSYWTFRKIWGVYNLSLQIKRGESFGFLGHNGAGKTTTMKSILGLIRKTTGIIELEGEELKHNSQFKTIGYLPEQPYFYDHLNVEETLRFFAELHGIRGKEKINRVNELLDLLGLTHKRKSPVRSLSKGLQQRLGIAQAIINKPKLLLLDEPFSGLDPIGRLEIRELLLELKQQGTTLFLSSHILSDVEDICDRVAIMASGELKTVFSLSDMAKLFGEAYELILSDIDSSESLLQSLIESSSKHETERGISSVMHIFQFIDYTSAHSAMKLAINHGARIEHFSSKSLSLEQIFMNITRSSRPHANGKSKAEVKDFQGELTQ